MCISDLVCAYEIALKAKDFTVMANLSGLGLEALSSKDESSPYAYYLSRAGVCPECGECDAVIRGFAVCHQHKCKWPDFDGEASGANDTALEDDVLEDYKLVTPLFHLIEKKRTSPADLSKFYSICEPF